MHHYLPFKEYALSLVCVILVTCKSNLVNFTRIYWKDGSALGDNLPRATDLVSVGDWLKKTDRIILQFVIILEPQRFC